MSEEKTPEFYKAFYDENRVALLQYESLRKHFNKMVDDVLGGNYYNMAMDVYESDKECCEDITSKCRNKCFFKRLFCRHKWKCIESYGTTRKVECIKCGETDVRALADYY